MKFLTILLDSQSSNPLKPILTLMGFAIAMIWYFMRNAKNGTGRRFSEAFLRPIIM